MRPSCQVCERRLPTQQAHQRAALGADLLLGGSLNLLGADHQALSALGLGCSANATYCQPWGGDMIRSLPITHPRCSRETTGPAFSGFGGEMKGEVSHGVAVGSKKRESSARAKTPDPGEPMRSRSCAPMQAATSDSRPNASKRAGSNMISAI